MMDKETAWWFFCAGNAPSLRPKLDNRNYFEELWLTFARRACEAQRRAEQELGYALMHLLMTADELDAWHVEMTRQTRCMLDGLIMRDVQ